MAAALWCNGLVSHAAAGELWGFEGITSDEIHVVVAATRRPRSNQVVVHRVGDVLPADVARRGPIPVTSALRTAIDLASVVDAESLEVAIESALRRRLFSVGQLRWRSDALMGTGRPGSESLRALLAARQLGASDNRWEVRAAQLLIAAGLPAPTRQHEVRANGRVIARADLAYPEARLIIEYDSDEWHAGTSAVIATRLVATSSAPSVGRSSKPPPHSSATRRGSWPTWRWCWRLRWGARRGGTRGGGALRSPCGGRSARPSWTPGAGRSSRRDRSRGS